MIITVRGVYWARLAREGRAREMSGMLAGMVHGIA
jgi:hypothetical protein